MPFGNFDFSGPVFSGNLGIPNVGFTNISVPSPNPGSTITTDTESIKADVPAEVLKPSVDSVRQTIESSMSNPDSILSVRRLVIQGNS